MSILVANSDFEKIWGKEYPTIAFDNATYSLAGEVGTKLTATFSITDNNEEDVTDKCTITFSNEYVTIEEDEGVYSFSCEDLEIGTYTTEVTATYEYLSATVTATATINISVEEEQATSISFDSAEYSFTGKERETLEANFSVDDNLGNDITNLCSYSFSPNDKGVVADFGSFNVESAVSGQYNVTVTATYGQLTTTATLVFDIEDLAETMSFDSNSYTISGTEGDTITQAFTVTDDKGNDLTSECEYTLSPNNTGLTISNGEFDASNVPEGTYSVTVTATYLQGEGAYDLQLDAQATISMDIASAGPDYSQNYLTIEMIENGTVRFTYPPNASDKITSISYSLDGGDNWITTPYADGGFTTPSINAGDSVLLKGIATQVSYPSSQASIIKISAKCNVSGNVMSLLYGDNFQNQTSFPSGSTYNFAYLFGENYFVRTNVVSAENLILPATELTNSCYLAMFMSQYSQLTKAPKLLATTLASSCYEDMFNGCSNLNAITMLATTLANNALNNWTSGVAATGTFTKAASMTTLPSGASGIPENWTVVDA